eukprot:4641811-Prymnesium_polylepis.1
MPPKASESLGAPSSGPNCSSAAPMSSAVKSGSSASAGTSPTAPSSSRNSSTLFSRKRAPSIPESCLVAPDASKKLARRIAFASPPMERSQGAGVRPWAAASHSAATRCIDGSSAHSGRGKGVSVEARPTSSR